MEEALPVREREKLRDELLAKESRFVRDLPKVEMHVHLEGTITAEMRWKLSQRNGTTLRIAKGGPEIQTFAELQTAMDLLRPDPSRVNDDEERFQFFEAYYEGFECLKTQQDYFDLAWHYLSHAAEQNVRWCELFFDPQGHTSRGISWETMMNGFREASRKAKAELNIGSVYIMCFLRDLPPRSALEHYHASRPYHDLIIGIGLDSNETDRPPLLFDEVFTLARRDGLKLTSHCDADSKNTHEHIRQAASLVGGHGLDRIDHGLNAAEKPELMELIKARDIGMTLCPWSYLRHTTFEELGPKFQTLYKAGIKVSINSDDPAYMEDCWILENYLLVQHLLGSEDSDMIGWATSAVEMCWAPEDVKASIRSELAEASESGVRRA